MLGLGLCTMCGGIPFLRLDALSNKLYEMNREMIRRVQEGRVGLYGRARP